MSDTILLAELGRMIRKKRLEKGITQNSLARLCGIGKANMSRMEAGKINVSIITLNKISKALGISIADLFKE